MKQLKTDEKHVLDYFERLQYEIVNFPEQYAAISQKFRWTFSEYYEGFSKYLYFPKGRNRTKRCFVNFIMKSEHYVSECACNELMNASKNEILNFTNEHVYPVNLFLRKDLANYNFQSGTYEDFLKFYNNRTMHAIITKDEDTHLRLLGLKQCMPENSNDFFARYKVAGIKVMPYTECRKRLLVGLTQND